MAPFTETNIEVVNVDFRFVVFEEINVHDSLSGDFIKYDLFLIVEVKPVGVGPDAIADT